MGVIATFIGNLPAMDGHSYKALDLFIGASVLLAAGVPAAFIMTAPTTLARRLGFTAIVWCLLILEVFILVVWGLSQSGVL